ncbi:hypothetical protein LX99_04225 [Mucilaginibacter oryzae]|uniref:Uncharacterized protein n=1 Tax=Mucilaginibacter oryzae TaxID=468058 RepID=A0A316HI63_9SPHI|nr:hypothetical protein [Mucilaginibacter oryzae]PWK72895.1 hypothetical protein LX99_04225 [Mucilaginibacter oryzae]
MTPEQATEIYEHLIEEMEKNGFGDITRQVFTRQQERYESPDGRQERFSPRRILFDYMDDSINILEQMSGHHYQKVLSRLNENLVEGYISEIEVELNDESIYPLQELPSYVELINELKSIRSELSESRNN